MIDDTSAEPQIQDLVYSLATSPNFALDGICFAARQSGLYRSEDGGITWRSTYDSLDLEAPLATTAVVVSSNFGSDRSVFAGAQRASCAQLMAAGIGMWPFCPRRRRLFQLWSSHRISPMMARYLLGRWKTVFSVRLTEVAIGPPGTLACWI